MNSLSFNKVLNKKVAIEEGRKQNLGLGVQFAKPISNRASFTDLRNRVGLDKIESTRLANNGKQIFEKVLQASKDDNEYFNSQKIFTKGANEGALYKR